MLLQRKDISRDGFVVLIKIWGKWTEEGKWEEGFENSWKGVGGGNFSVKWKLKWERDDFRKDTQLPSSLLPLPFFPCKHMDGRVETDLE